MADGPDDLMTLMGPVMAANPRAMYKTMREASPVMRVGNEVVVLSAKADIDEAFRHPEVYSSNWSAIDLGNVRPLIPLQIDPPDHVRYRRLLDPLFAPREMARLESQIAGLVHRLVDRFVDRGSCDLVSEFTIPLPSEVFLTMFGLPLEELDTFLRMKNGIIHASGTAAEQVSIRRKTATEMSRSSTSAAHRRPRT
jgi:cytochrome P450